MKRAAPVLRVLLAAAMFAPPSAFAQTRAVVPGAGSGAPALVPSLGTGPSAPSLSAPSSSLVAPSLSGAVLPAAPSIVPSAAAAAAAVVPAALAPVRPAASGMEKGAAPILVEKGREPVPPSAGRRESPSALAEMPADLKSAAAAGRRFDGAKEKARTPEEPVEPETVTREVSDKEVPEDLALWFTRKDKVAIKKSQLYTLVRPIYGEPSRRYWEKFEEGKTILIKVAGQGMFMAPVTYAKTVAIAKMTREDFKGVYTSAQMRGKSLEKLRQKLLGELNERNDRGTRGQSGVVTRLSEVRVVRVMPYGEAKQLPVNKDEVSYDPTPRVQYELPAPLQGLNHMTPKLVVLDMRLFKEGVPYPLIEDMTKLMKSGVYFALLSDKPADEVERQLSSGLTMKQKEMISRYKMVVLSDDGNALSSFDGAFARFLPSIRFTPQEQELMKFAASLYGAEGEMADHGTRFTAYPKNGQTADSAAGSLRDSMHRLGLDADKWKFSVVNRKGRPAIDVRPQNLAGAVPYLLEKLREHEGLYVNPSDVMTISADDALRAALNGSIDAAGLLPQRGAELADASLASILGPYRENKPGDLAASASKITGFLHDPDRTGFGGSRGNIYMMMGHVMHSAFNWAVWKYRNEGVLPSADATIAEARKIWDREEQEREGNALDRPGEQIAGFYEVMQGRLGTMHAVLADVLRVYPIAIGTELPNMLVFDNYKKGQPDNRDVLRLIFDLVVARETPEGLDVVIVDFKTGQTPTLQNLEKDVQVQLYDLAVRKMWPRLAVPYGGTGELKDASDNYKIRFIYPSAGYQPMLNEWTRIKFERFLRNVMNRIRRHNAPPAPKAEAKAKKKPAKKK